MAKDYKNRIPAYRQQKKKAAARTWGIAGAAATGVAALVALGIYVFSAPGGESAEPSVEAAAEPAPEHAAGKTAAKPDTRKKTALKEKSPPDSEAPEPPAPPPEPRFSFYKLLPEKEVVIAENEIKAMKREESQGKKPGAAYLLQAGSFTRQEDAEKLKARLAEVKIKAKLEMIKLDNTAWYRVKIGPYATLADADKVRQYLRGNRIDSIVQKAAQ
jgi:cell division protein FtsN